MKGIVFFSAAVLLMAVSGAEAQAPAAPNTFPTLDACNEALRSGQLRFYEPRFFGLKTRNPVDNRERIAVPLESDACLEMLVVGGRRFVAQREGTLFRAHRLADGSLSLYARDDCGNPVYGVVYPAPAIPVPVVEELLEPVIVPDRQVGPAEPERRYHRVHPVKSKKKGGFCSSKTCRLTIVAIGGAAAGYAAWRYWPCPPGTVRR